MQGCGMSDRVHVNSGKLALLYNNKFENKNAGFVEFIVATEFSQQSEPVSPQFPLQLEGESWAT
jgi:hypothetical protein